MRLVEFLILLLDAHAQTLKRLAAPLGEERLLEVVEAAGERADDIAHAKAAGREAPEAETPEFDLKASWFEPPRPGDPRSPYSELESAVHEMHIPEFMEFHVWAYPHYRQYIESALDLNLRIPGPGEEIGSILVTEAVAAAERWVRSLQLPAAIAPQAERAAQLPWLQFRTATLKRIGKRPMMPVY